MQICLHFMLTAMLSQHLLKMLATPALAVGSLQKTIVQANEKAIHLQGSHLLMVCQQQVLNSLLNGSKL